MKTLLTRHHSGIGAMVIRSTAALVAAGSLMFVAPIAAFADGGDGQTARADRVLAAVARADTEASGADNRQAYRVDGRRISIGALGVTVAQSSGVSVVRSGGVVLPGTQSGVAYSVRSSGGGVQIAAVLASRESPRTMTFDYGTAVLQSAGDGGVLIRESADRGPIGYIASPWAKDANGAAVATSYQISGSTLTQVVSPTSSTVFPVVADPTTYITLTDIYTRFTRSETQWLASNGSYFAIGAAACRIIPYLPVSLACTVYASWALINIGQGIVAANNAGRCAAVHFYLVVPLGYLYGKTDSWSC